MSSDAAPLLQICNVSESFGALADVSTEIQHGEIVALIGMIGAGKSTLTRAITNRLPLRSGAVVWRGEDLAGQLGGTLWGGEQQMLAIGQALMALPASIVFGEISLGLAPRIIDTIHETIPVIAANGTTVLPIEQNVYRSPAIADRANILERGSIAMSGTSRQLMENKEIQEAHFGLKTH